MAGTLTISTLSDGTYTTSSTNIIRGVCVAWVAFNGTSGAVLGGYNVGSVTRNSTGNYTVNYTNALADTLYCVSGSTVGTTNLTGSGNATGIFNLPTATSVKSTTQVSLAVVNNNDSANVDANCVSIVIHR